MSLTAFLVAVLSFCQVRCPICRFWALRPFAALVARNTVQGVHMHEQNIVIFINQLDGLVYLAVLVDLDQTAETPHAVIDMYHIIAHAELIQLCDGHLLVALDLAVDPIALVAVENLMVGIETKFQVVIDETLMRVIGGG